mgnify:CR=1 FL=1
MSQIKLRCLEVANDDANFFTKGKVYPLISRSTMVRSDRGTVLSIDVNRYDGKHVPAFDSKFRILLMPNTEPVK